MKSLKETIKDNIKQKLREDLVTPELGRFYDNILHGDPATTPEAAAISPSMRKHYTFQERGLLASPHLYTLNTQTGKPERVAGASLSPELHAALTAVVSSGSDYRPISREHQALIKDFVAKHGPFDFSAGVGGRMGDVSKRGYITPTS